MKRKVKSVLALLLTFALVLSVPFAFSTQEASAASKKAKKVTINVMKSYTYNWKSSDGSFGKYVARNTFNSKGFITRNTARETYKEKGKKTKTTRYQSVYKYNKKGFLKSYKYTEKGKKKETMSVKFNKKGLPVSAKSYQYKGKKKLLYSEATFTWSGDALVNVTWKNAATGKSGAYNPELRLSDVWEGDTPEKNDEDYKNNSGSYTDEEDGSTTTYSTSYSFNKKGYLTRETNKETVTYTDGTKTTSNAVWKYQTKRIKAKNLAIRAINYAIEDAVFYNDMGD